MAKPETSYTRNRPSYLFTGLSDFITNSMFEETRKDLEQMMTAQLIGKPYEAFVFASKEDDRDLGGRAIRWMDPAPGFDIWTAISGANPHWQIALIKTLVPLPFPTSSYLERRWQSKVSFMKEVSATFDPE